MFLFIFCSSVKFQGPKSIPDHWDPSAVPDPGFKVGDMGCMGLGSGMFLEIGESERLCCFLPSLKKL